MRKKDIINRGAVLILIIIGAIFLFGLVGYTVLGCAFEPEQRFENPDETAIQFDDDFLGNHRGVAPIPGPFASAESAASTLA